MVDLPIRGSASFGSCIFEHQGDSAVDEDNSRSLVRGIRLSDFDRKTFSDGLTYCIMKESLALHPCCLQHLVFSVTTPWTEPQRIAQWFRKGRRTLCCTDKGEQDKFILSTRHHWCHAVSYCYLCVPSLRLRASMAQLFFCRKLGQDKDCPEQLEEVNQLVLQSEFWHVLTCLNDVPSSSIPTLKLINCLNLQGADLHIVCFPTSPWLPDCRSWTNSNSFDFCQGRVFRKHDRLISSSSFAGKQCWTEEETGLYGVHCLDLAAWLVSEQSYMQLKTAPLDRCVLEFERYGEVTQMFRWNWYQDFKVISNNSGTRQDVFDRHIPPLRGNCDHIGFAFVPQRLSSGAGCRLPRGRRQVFVISHLLTMVFLTWTREFKQRSQDLTNC